MAVYVDNMEAKFGRMIMCHMAADTSDELFEMADKIGVARKWVQDIGSAKEHFDISKSKKKLAIQHGAIQVSMKELVARSIKKADSYEAWLKEK